MTVGAHEAMALAQSMQGGFVAGDAAAAQHIEQLRLASQPGALGTRHGALSHGANAPGQFVPLGTSEPVVCDGTLPRRGDQGEPQPLRGHAKFAKRDRAIPT